MPTTYAWSKVGERKIINYEAPKKRRVNAVGAYSGDDFRFHVESGKLTAEVFVDFLDTLLPKPGEPPVVVVLDNYAVHKAKRIQPRLAELRAKGLNLFFLPPYSPELNLIEPCWRHVKHHHMPTRLFQSQRALHDGVEGSLSSYQDSIRRSVRARAA